MNHSEKRISKFLSLLLRHKPEVVGLFLDAEGWAEVHELLQKLEAHGEPLTREELQVIVDTNEKKRFAFSEDGTRIRASQGHSVAVDLQWPAQAPPDILYHGTTENNLASILELGIRKGSRHHVHLSADEATARQVGGRRGRPVVLGVDAGRMAADGIPFYRSENGVWLTDEVAPQYLLHR